MDSVRSGAHLVAAPRLAPRPHACSAPRTTCRDSQRVQLSFRLPYRTNFGEQLCLVGSGSPFGNWDVSRGLSMTWSDGDVWKADLDVEMEPEHDLQYKYVVKGTDGGVVSWMSGDNMHLRLPETEEEEISSIRICDAWDGSYRDVAWDSGQGKGKPVITHDQRVQERALELHKDKEMNVVAVAAMQAFVELEELMNITVEEVSDLADPAAPEALAADRGVARKARKALTLAHAVEAADDDEQALAS